jgi:peptidoglycan/xylan/chitin deacetylase (PgdA/CDA1 family)
MNELISFLNQQDITYFDWNVSVGDADGRGISTQQVINNCLAGLRNKDEAIVLMHDAGSKNSTVEALPRIIAEILSYENTAILPISDETVPIQHITVD